MSKQKQEKQAVTQSSLSSQDMDRIPESRQYGLVEQTTRRVRGTDSVDAHAATINRATGGQPARAKHFLHRLQRVFGNRHVQRVISLARKAERATEVASEVEDSIRRARGGGQALDRGVRGQMESAIGGDFSGVRVHTDSKADALSQELNARAFTTSKDIFFKQGEYNPGSSSGRELLAHELTHVVQQTGSTRPKLTVGKQGDKYEQEADQISQAVIQQEQEVFPQERIQTGIRRQDEEEELQMQPLKDEDEELQMDTEAGKLSRQVEDEEEELIQTRRFLEQIAPLDQRQLEEQEGEIPLVEHAGKRVTRGEQRARIEAARIMDGLTAMMVSFGGGLLNFKTVLEAPSSQDIKPQIGKVLMEYARDQIFGAIASKIPGASIAYDICKEIDKAVNDAEKKQTLYEVANFFVAHNTWAKNREADCHRLETEVEIDALHHYRSISSKAGRDAYLKQLKARADEIQARAKAIDTNAVFKLLSEKWIQQSKHPKFGYMGLPAAIEIHVDKLATRVTQAIIHAPGGAQLADQFNKKGMYPLELKVKKIIIGEGWRYRHVPLILDKSNKIIALEPPEAKMIVSKGRKALPLVKNWSGD